MSLATPVDLMPGAISELGYRHHGKAPLCALVGHLRAMNLWSGDGPSTIGDHGGYQGGVIPGGTVARIAVSSSGKSVYDQVLREEQALIARNDVLLKAAQQEIAHVSLSCCGTAASKGHHSPNASKR